MENPSVDAAAAQPGWRDRLQQQPLVQRGRHWYARYGAVTFFLGGVVWDALTLKRIDAPTDNLLLLGYLVVLGLLLPLVTLIEAGRITRPWMLRFQQGYPAAVQFCFGALFSAYVVFYSQSVSFSGTALYLGVLVVLLVVNEFLHQRLLYAALRFGLYFLACTSFLLFIIPILTRTMGYGTFLAASVLSLLLVGWMLRWLYRSGAFLQKSRFFATLAVVLALFGLLQVFYWFNLIPPVPLSLRDGGIYHQVTHEGPVYRLRYEAPSVLWFWQRSDRAFRYVEGDTVYCFAAVFAPTDLRQRVYHHWQRYDEQAGRWVTADRIGYGLLGGRYTGYRGYTFKRTVSPGRWRVDVETEAGQTLGRIPFTLIPVDATPRQWKTMVYE
jgi:hypothetical protein